MLCERPERDGPSRAKIGEGVTKVISVNDVRDYGSFSWDNRLPASQEVKSSRVSFVISISDIPDIYTYVHR